MPEQKCKTKVIVTLGPATRSEEDLRAIKARGVDFVRINMSHSSLDDLRYFIALAKKVGLPFIIDTEGSQIRTGDLEQNKVFIEESAEVKIYIQPIVGNTERINLRPKEIVAQLERGDILHVDFDSLILRVSDISTIDQGYITARAVSAGVLGNNKAVVIDPGMPKRFVLPPFSQKDYESIQIGLSESVEYISASYMRTGASVDEVRRVTEGKMKIISKIECQEALDNLDDIIAKSDFLLLDRGDLSKEIPIEKIPLTQKMVIARANRAGRGVFIATNFLESMVMNKKPTRAEAVDVVNAVLDGAYGLMLSAETAIGKHPIACVNMLNKLIAEAEQAQRRNQPGSKSYLLADTLESMNYLTVSSSRPGLVKLHGGALVDRVLREAPDEQYLASLPRITLDQDRQMDVEQIAIGTFSPIDGFMGKKDFMGVLDNMRLESGDVWTIPIILDGPREVAENLETGKDVALCDNEGPMAILHLEEKYEFDKDETNQKLYGTTSTEHPGVRWINGMHPVLLGGKIDLIRRRKSEHKEYELTPRQVRRMFEERGWSKIVGFHTRNVIHRSHEFIQLEALRRVSADGLFVHPVIGKKKPGDFHAKYIIGVYEQMVKDFYPKDKVVFATYATFSRYAGPREAIFTALCRKNFGCSHFIVGRDHTGVGNFYHPKAAHEIFDKFDDLGIEPVRFDQIFYSNKIGKHIHEADDNEHAEEEKMTISGTQARGMFEQGQRPPEWFIRPEISDLILNAISRGEEVFVPKDGNDGTGMVLWFTGLSGSGKSALANELKMVLQMEGKSVLILDGDDVRKNKHFHLGFGREDIRENNRIIANMAKEKAKEYDFVLVSVISPYQEDRDMVCLIIGDNARMIYINADLDTCIRRDVKGLYGRALKGEIENFIGISPSSPYEAPVNPAIEIKTAELNLEDSIKKIMDYLNGTAG